MRESACEKARDPDLLRSLAMNAKVVKSDERADGGRTYAVEATGATLAIEFYPGDAEAGERPWHADIRFVEEEQDLTGGDVSPRSAFFAAVSRHETLVRGGHPMPAVAWADIAEALEAVGAFGGAARAG
jgi:hypothetical protein